VEITKAYLQKKFEEYYSKASFKVRDLDRREWAFVPINAIPDFFMLRHIAFSDLNELKGYILSKIPLHAYYSSAYYERPGEEKMEEKGWICADLIFDIDADHIPIKADMEKALEVAKKEIVRLYKILERDFGISDMEIVFSGNRGYHIHVHDKDFLNLESTERREIVNYLTFNRFSIDSPNSTQKRRVCRCTTKLIYSKIKRGIIKNKRLRKKIEINKKNLYSCDLSVLAKKERSIFEEHFKYCVNLLKVHIDEPVTADIHRLIRLPNSLHGKTGFVVKPLSIYDLDEFDPFKDAIVFGNENVKVRCLKRANFKIGDINMKVRPGEKLKLPEYAAIFLICRGIALYGH